MVYIFHIILMDQFFEGYYENGIRKGEWKYYNDSVDIDTIIYE